MTGIRPWLDNDPLGRTGWDSEEGKIARDVREQWECTELCLGKDNEPDESIWFRIRGPPTGVALWWVSATDHLIRNKQMRPSSDNWEKPRIQRPWFS